MKHYLQQASIFTSVGKSAHTEAHAAWASLALKELASEITVAFVGPMVSEYRSTGIPFLRSQNIEAFRINSNDLRFIGPEFHARIAKSRIKPGDVVIVRTGTSGISAVVHAPRHVDGERRVVRALEINRRHNG